MLKKTITFDNLDGERVTEDFYFNISKAEMLDMTAESYEVTLQKMLDTKDNKVMLDLVKDLVGRAIGKRSEDGKRFIKTPEIRDDFLQSEAFYELFVELANDEGNASVKFFAGLMPKSLVEKAQATILPVDPPKIENVAELTKPENQPKPWIAENREPTSDELRLMTKAELFEAFKAQQAAKQTDESAAFQEWKSKFPQANGD